MIKDRGRPLSEEDLIGLEERIGCHLPDSYRRFLMENNGGRPNPDGICVAGIPGGETDIKKFYGIDLPIESSNIDWNVMLVRKSQIPEHMLPIANDSGGYKFCISLADGDRGSIYCCEVGMGGSITLHRVATDFDAFLGSIRD